MSLDFDLAGGITAVVLILMAVGVGRSATKNSLGILIDGRGRFSLKRLQVVMWTILVVSTLVGISMSTLKLPEIPTTLLALMGISIGTAVTAGAVKSAKDFDPTAKVARAGTHALSTGATRTIVAKLAQLYLEEEGDQADVTVSITKFQMLVFTLVLGLIYVVLSVQQKGFPDMSASAAWLTGISYAGYVVGKVPNKS